MLIYTGLEYKILELIRQYNITSTLSSRLSFGGGSGPGGGFGGPITTPIGQLPQTYICYDTSELATTYVPGSGTSLLDNLNRIRSGLTIVPSGYVPINFTVTGDGNLFDYLEGIDNALGDSPEGADPTSYIGLTPYNGVATTFMRSDAAPALDQGIIPTWSGDHTWQPTTDSDSTLRVNDNAGDIVFTVNTDEKWVGINVLPSGILHILQEASANEDVLLDLIANTSTGFELNFRMARGDYLSEEVVQDDDKLGIIKFLGYSAAGGQYVEAASIVGRVDGTPDDDATDMPGALDFNTTPDGQGTTKHAATIDKDANLGILTKTPGKDIVGGGQDFNGVVFHLDNAGEAHLIADGISGGFLDLIDAGAAADDKILQFEVDGGELVIRSLNDDLTTRIDNTLKIDLGTGLTTLLTLALSTGGGTTVNKISTDGTLATNSDDFICTEQAIKTYVDGHVSPGSGHVIEDATTAFPHQDFLQFLGDVTVIDDDPNNRTIVTISGVGSALVVKGDLLVRDVTTTTRLGVGNDDEVIIADSAESLGMKWGATPAGTSANPTGTVGLSVVNGVETTYMRSDAAPPLSQAIVPTWTGDHEWDDGGGRTLLIDVSERAITLSAGTSISEFSTDGTLAGDSDDAVPTEKAVLTAITDIISRNWMGV